MPLKNQFVSFCTERGMRATERRLAVVDVIARFEGPFSAEDVMASSAEQHLTVGLATTYRTLQILEAMEKLARDDRRYRPLP